MFGFFKGKKGGSESRSSSGIEIIDGADDSLYAVTDDGQIVSKDEFPDVFESMISGDKARKISKETAMSLSAVYSCIDRISSNIAMMPIEIRQVTDDKNTIVTEHDASYLLGTSPNLWQDAYLFKQQIMCDVLTDGNFYVWIDRDRAGNISEFKYFAAKSVGLYNTGKNRWVYDATDDEGYNYIIFPEDMVHVRALGNKSRKGLSPISLHNELLNMGLSAQEYGSSFFSSGGRPTGIVGIKGGNLTPQGMDNIKATWKKAVKMADSNNRTIFIPGDITYTQMSISPIDAKIVEMLKMTRSEVAGVFNVPAYLIGDLDKANYSNITQQSISFVRNTLQPWITAMEAQMNVKIFTRKEIASGLRVSFDMDVLIRGTPLERAQIAHYQITDGWKNRNEVRKSEGCSRVEGQGMDDYLVSVNAVQQSKDDNGTVDTGNSANDNSLNPNGDDSEVKK